MADKEDAEFGKSLAEYENLEKQLEVVLIQKNQLSLQIAEAKNALEELKDAKGEVYRSVGSLILKTTKEEAEKKLKERLELMEVKHKAISKEEERLKEAVLKLQQTLKEKMEKYEKKS
ncbi:MAG: prefoldin subunit beta [Candidatus Bilamarchaeaceae archaeon]